MSQDVDAEAQRILDLGMTTLEHVEEAKAVREKMLELGLKPRSLGQILYEKGYIEEEQLEALRREDRKFEGREQIAGYRLLERLGGGAMGTVYKARQLSLDRDVAIKILAPELAEDPTFVERFLREAKAVARLNHANIISGIDVGDADGVKYFVMEYVDGSTVASLLRRGGALDEERALLVGQQICRALDHAYKNNLVHRDLKPENVLITRDGIAKVCDLGLAKLEDLPQSAGEARRMGTPDYISPEQARGEANVDIRSDLYSLGATLYHMLVGRPPFEAATPAAVMAKHMTEMPAPVRRLDPTISPLTDVLVLRLMQKRREDRFQTPAEALAKLDEAVKALQAARGVVAPNVAAAGAASPAAGAKAAAAPAPTVTKKQPIVTPRRRPRY
ncbi:MAG: serine/threonine protein kinase [Planctomycetia bacterium]|nr:serine/threonine protein kinase [Planctomycetia bacterium]